MRNLSAIWVNGDYYCFVSNLNFPNHTEIQRPSSYLLYKNTNKNPKNLQDFWRISWCYSFFIGLPYLNDFQNIALSCALILRSEGKTDSMNEWMFIPLRQYNFYNCTNCDTWYCNFHENKVLVNFIPRIFGRIVPTIFKKLCMW